MFTCCLWALKLVQFKEDERCFRSNDLDLDFYFLLFNILNHDFNSTAELKKKLNIKNSNIKQIKHKTRKHLFSCTTLRLFVGGKAPCKVFPSLR